MNQLSSACLRKFGRHMSKQAQQNPAMIIKKFRSNLELLGTEGKHQSRLISLTHKAQLKRFTQDITKILKVISFLGGNNSATDCESYRPPREVFYGLLESVKKCIAYKENFCVGGSSQKIVLPIMLFWLAYAPIIRPPTHLKPTYFDR